MVLILRILIDKPFYMIGVGFFGEEGEADGLDTLYYFRFAVIVLICGLLVLVLI